MPDRFTAGALAALCALLVAALGMPALAQQPRNDAGLGTVKRSFDISARVAAGPLGGPDLQITAAVFCKGKTFVTSDAERNSHWIYILDAVGNYEGAVDVRATGAIPAHLVLYDMATDGESLMVAVGESFDSGDATSGIYVLDIHGQPADTVLTDNGLRTVTNPIRGPGFDRLRSFATYPPPGSPYRGLAFDPSGDGGNGSFWVGDDGGVNALNEAVASPILEIDLQGNILRELANNPDGLGVPRGGWWYAGGIALDNQTGNLWVLADGDDNVIEVNVLTGMPTGKLFAQEKPPDGFRGGLSSIVGGDPGTSPSDLDMLVVSRMDGPDHIAYQRVNLYPGMPGVSEPYLEGSVDANPLGSVSPILFTDTNVLNFAVNLNGRGPAPAFLFVNFGAEALADVPTLLPLGVLPELRSYSPISTPPTVGSALVVPITTGHAFHVDLGAIEFPVATGDTIRLQAVYFDSRSQYSPGLMASNEIWFNGMGTSQVLFEAVGPNSNQPDLNAGFFRVHWLGGPDIVEVVLDFAASDNPALANAVFDTDAPDMGDFFGAGSSHRAGCSGTYRLGSDLVTGLIHDVASNSRVELNSPVCDFWSGLGVSWTSGFVGSPGPGPSYRTLTFHFDHFGLDTPGGNPAAVAETLQFDCDTDGTPTGGGGHAGMVVTFKLADGTVLVGSTVLDPSNRSRSFLGF